MSNQTFVKVLLCEAAMRCSVLLKKLGHILSQRKMHLKMAFQVQKFLVCCSLTTSSLAWKVKVIYRLGNKKKEETKFTGEVKGPLLAWNGLGILKRLSTRQKRKKAKKTKVSCEKSFKMRKTCQHTEFKSHQIFFHAKIPNSKFVENENEAFFS